MLFRKISGGYHAKTVLLCNIFTTFNLILAIITIRLLNQSFWNGVCMSIAIISLICSIFIAPIDNENKRFSEDEYKHYSKLSKILSISTTIIIFFLCFVLPNNIYVLSFCIGIISANISLILAFLERRLKHV